ncbi:MAG: sensor domain-containing diguanylate cyclase [Eubacteriaceae bacterium]
MKVKKKLPLKIISLGIIPLLIVTIITTIYATSMTIFTRKTFLNEIAASVNEHIETFFVSQKSNLDFSTKTPIYINLLDAVQTDPNSQTQQDLMAEANQMIFDSVQTNVDLSQLNIIDLSGNIVISSTPSLNGTNLSDQPIMKSLKEGAPFYEETIINPDNTRSISLAQPIINDNGNLVGYINRVSSLENINQYIHSFTIGNTGYLYLLDNKGVTLSHYYENRITDTEDQKPKEIINFISEIKSNTLPSDHGFLNYEINNVDILGAYGRVETPQWVIVAAMNKNEIYMEVYGILLIALVSLCIVAITSVFIGKSIANSIIKPLTILTDGIKEISHGNLLATCELEDNKDEFNTLADNFNQMALNLYETTKKLVATNEKLDHSAHFDLLTDIPNRKSIYEFIDRTFKASPNQGMFLFDLDGFKLVNDHLGHDVGDLLLQKVGSILKRLSSDVFYPARLGGDEFLIFIPDYKNLEEIETIAKDLLKEIANLSKLQGLPVRVSASLGIALLNTSTPDKSQLIKEADRAMYEAKKSGGNTYVLQGSYNAC